MTITIHEFEQGTDEWHDARRGIVTASSVGQLITPSTVKVSDNDFSRGLTASLVAERITGHTDPVYVSVDMERGNWDEPIARDLYGQHHAPVKEIGFVTRDDWGFTIGYSPDGYVGDDGLIEIKSRRQKKHLQTILDERVPPENMAQCQAGLLVSGRAWIDYVSFCGGMPLWTKRVLPDQKWFDAIIAAVEKFEHAAKSMTAEYELTTANLPKTERSFQFEEMRLA